MRRLITKDTATQMTTEATTTEALTTWYHGTSSLNLNSISQSGLKPHGNSGAFKWAQDHPDSQGDKIPPPGDSVYLTQDFGEARWYANATADEIGGDPIVLKIVIPASGLQTDPADDEAKEYSGTIPATAIKGWQHVNHDLSPPH